MYLHHLKHNRGLPKRSQANVRQKDFNKTLDSHDTHNQKLKRDKRPLTLHKNNSHNLEN